MFKKDIQTKNLLRPKHRNKVKCIITAYDPLHGHWWNRTHRNWKYYRKQQYKYL